MSTRHLLAGALALVLLAGTATAADIEREFEVTPGGTLDIDTDVGSIDVAVTDSDRVLIEISLRGPDTDRLEFDFEQNDNGVRVKSRLRRDRWGDRSQHLSARIRAQVPSTYNVRLDTAGGSIDVGDLDGQVRADTSGGSINVGRVTGPVRADTSGGSIEIEASEKDVDADTSGGSIRLGEMRGRVKADTSGGSIRIDSSTGPVRASTSGGNITVRSAGGPVDASTSGGGVLVRFTGQPDDDSDLSTSGGNVTAEIADGLRFDVRARSGNRVKSEFQLDDAIVEDGRLEGKLNGGGPRLSMRSSGRVRLDRL